MRLLLLSIAVLIIAAPAYAEVAETTIENRATPAIIKPPNVLSRGYYKSAVMKAIRERPKNFDFSSLRNNYPSTEDYDPIGESARSKILDAAFAIQNEQDPEKRKKAFDEYGALISAHLGNIDVVSQALVLAQEDKVFGDPQFFLWVRNGLMRDLAGSGTGRNLTQAYDAMTLGEEAFLMNILRLKVLKTETAEEGGVYYNMHEVQDPKYPEPYWMFVNITQPMQFLEQKKREGGNSYTIPHQ